MIAQADKILSLKEAFPQCFRLWMAFDLLTLKLDDLYLEKAYMTFII